MTNEVATMSEKAIEVLAIGNLQKMTDAEKTQHYLAVCNSMGMNPLTRPLEYLTLNGKLTLYARKDATDQLRKINGISIAEPVIRFEDQWIIVTVSARTADGRTDSDIGVVSKTDMQGNFGNSLMKSVTKAKRRVTLSICGLGMLDETEVETIPHATLHQHQPKPVQPQAALPAGGQQQSPPADDLKPGAVYMMLTKTIAAVATRTDLARVRELCRENRAKMSRPEQRLVSDQIKLAEQDLADAESESARTRTDLTGADGNLPD